LIFDHQGKGFDFVFLTFYLFHSSPFFSFVSICLRSFFLYITSNGNLISE
jgi:hypothetical protein